jgi:hypothetical protein
VEVIRWKYGDIMDFNEEMNCEKESNYQKICNVQSEIAFIKETLIGNLNKSIIDIRETVRALDTRTSIFCPDSKSKQDNNEKMAFERKAWNRLDKHAKEIQDIKRELKNG